MRLKTIFAGTTALALAGATLVYAQQRQQGPGDYGGRAEEQSRGQRDPDRDGPARLPRDRLAGFSREDRAAFLNARIAALKAGLELTSEQEKSWPAFEAALRNLDALRTSRMGARRDEQLPPSRIERLRREADALSNKGSVLRQLADAEESLLNTLSDAQRRRFFFFARLERRFELGRLAGRDFAGPSGPEEEGRGPRDRIDGWSGRRDGDRSDRSDRDEWRRGSLAERPDWSGMDWRGRRGFDDPRGRDGWQDRRGPRSTNGMDGYDADDLDGDND
jgi:zinc resistance-associated protein